MIASALSRPAQLKKLRDIMVKTVKYSREQLRPDGTAVRVEEPMFVDDDDPDPNYVLTMDNAKKILAIHQRLRYVWTICVGAVLKYKTFPEFIR